MKENNTIKNVKKSKSYYQFLYGFNSENEEKNNENRKASLTEKITKMKKKQSSLIKIFKRPVINKNKGPKWPKVTIPKLPFSRTKKEEPEIIKKRIELLKPSKLYHDFHTIQWLRKKYSESVIEKSVFSILPENGKAKIPKDESERKKRKRKMMEFLDSLKGPIGREKYVKINPKYLYNPETYEKIKKLKEIFLEFDGGGYRKMEMNELLSLFNQNNIRADIEELVGLFFKDKNIKKEDYSKLYLNFYEFLNFALTKEQDFRQFMRNIKEKYKNEQKGNDNDNTYLPMNLNLVLDYFINKSKERSSIEKIEKAINEMDVIIKENTAINNNPQQEFLNLDLKTDNSTNKIKNNQKKTKSPESGQTQNHHNKRIKNNKNGKTLFHANSKDYSISKYNSKNDLKVYKKNENDDYEKKLEKIDFKQLIEEFSNLFNYNGLNNIENFDKKRLLLNNHFKKLNNFNNRINSFNKARKKTQGIKSLSTNNIFSTQNLYTPNSFSISSMKNNINKSNIPSLYQLADDENEIIENAVKCHMNEKSILKMNIDNYEKLHDIKLAVNATKDLINTIKQNDNNDIKNNTKKSKSHKLLPEIRIIKDKKENKYLLKNFNKIGVSGKAKQFINNKSNSFKIFKRNDQRFFNSKSHTHKNYLCDNINFNNNNNSKVNKSNRTFLNIYYGKSQLINMSQEQTDYGSKSKMDYVPLEFLQ